MRRMKWLAMAVAGVTCLASRIAADEVSSLKSEMADMKVKMAAMESALQAVGGHPGGGEVESLQSLKKKGAVQIGGDVCVDLIFKHRDDITSDHDRVDSTEFHTNSANLRFKISGGQNQYLLIKLDLDDSWDDDRFDGVADQDDLLEECKFVWEHIRGTNWGMVFGKGEVPYGQDKTLGIIQSYHHNDQAYSSEGPVLLIAGTEESADVEDSNPGNPHQTVLFPYHPGEVDNVFMVGVNYTWKNMLKFEFAVFQNNDTDPFTSTGNGQGRITRGMHEDRPDDNMLFQSMAGRIWFLPTEGLTIELSAIRKHFDTLGDRQQFGSKSRSESYAVSVGFDYKARTVPIELFGEYQHGWDWAYFDDYYVQIAQIGFLWNITDAIKGGMMYEWMGHDYEFPGIMIKGEDRQKFVVSAQYYCTNDLYFILEYGYEYFNGDLPNADDDRDGHLVGFRTGWAF